MNIVKVPAYRIASESNTTVGENALVGLLPGGIESYLGEITISDEFLRYAYVSERHPPQDGGNMNLSDAGQYGPNVFSERAKDGTWRTADRLSAFGESIRQLASDAAELHLIDRILSIGKGLDPNIYSPGFLSGGDAAPRLCFVQGGIGCGKTTMLHHLIRLMIPDLRSGGLLPFALPIGYYDLNNLVVDNDFIQPHWEKVLESYQTQVGQQTGLNSTEGWQVIAHEDIYEESGQRRPDIEYDQGPDDAVRSVIGHSKNPAVFLRRVARRLWKSPSPSPVVFVLDNLDWVPSRTAQLRFASRLLGLLKDIPSAVGIITVREYTLGEMEEAVQEFAAFYHVNRMHMTTPFMGEVVRRRLARAIAGISEEQALDTPIQIRERITVSHADCKALLQHIVDAFEPEIVGPRNSPIVDLEGSMTRLSVFLYNVTNSNIRAALQIVSTALKSWALTHDRFVAEYLERKRLRGAIRLSPFTVDELVRLASVGPWLHYDGTQCGFFHNVFATDHGEPNRARGYAPLLHVYRILQLCGRSHWATVREITENLKCLALSPDENWTLLQMLQERGFVESRAGLVIDENKALYPTRKLHFYLRRFSSSLVYLSMVRNDCHLEYSARPWDFHHELIESCHEALKFIWYVLDQEAVQYDYAKAVNRADSFGMIAGDWPVGWKLLHSLSGFLASANERGRIPRPQWEGIQLEIIKLAPFIRDLIKQDSVYGHIDEDIALG